MISTTRKVRFARRPDRSRAIVRAPDVPGAAPAGRVPRVARLMALAIHFERLLREGKVRDQSELARLAHVTQPRMTQIMNLNRLAPDIQEELLFLPTRDGGREAVHERLVRPLTSTLEWPTQRRRWRCVLQGSDRRPD